METVADKILKLIADISEIDGKQVTITTSIGVVHCQKANELSVDELINFADSLMYEAKRSGKNRYVIRAYSAN